MGSQYKTINNHKSAFIILVIIFICTSCIKDSSTPHLHPDLLNESNDTLYYSTFVDSTKYIHLESTDECIIGEITDLKISSDKIFIFDKRQQTIWIFDKSGKYKNRISKQGAGPDEYKRMNQFEYNEKNNQISILDSWNKSILFYDLEGNMLKKIELDLYASDFKITPQGEFVLSLAGETKAFAGIYFADKNGKTTKKLLDRNKKHLISCNLDWELCSYDNSISFMSPNFENHVYQFKNKELNLIYPFEFLPEIKDVYNKNTSKEHLKDFIRTEYIEGNKWILATYWSSKHDVRIFIFSKDKNQYFICKNLENDIDHIKRGGKTSMSDNNKFVFWSPNDSLDCNPILQVLYLK